MSSGVPAGWRRFGSNPGKHQNSAIRSQFCHRARVAVWDHPAGMKLSCMVGIDWGDVATLCAELLATASAIYGINKARKIRLLALRFLGISFCGIVALLGSLCVVAFLGLSSCDSHSALIYSPSRDVAARTNNFDYGATGGDTSVTLHWARGLRSQTIYSGEWRSVEPQDIQWNGDSMLTIYYLGDKRSCSSTPHVDVVCVPRDSRFPAPTAGKR